MTSSSSFRRGALALALLAASAAAASDLPVPKDATTSAFGPGEQVTYQVHYLGLAAGTAQITVGAEMRQWGKEIWPIVAIAKTESMFAVYPVKDKFVTYWEPYEGRTIGSDLFADENKKRRRQRIKMDHASKTAQVMKQREGDAEVEERHEIVPGAFDAAAATFALRNRDLAVGLTFQMPIFTGKNNFDLRGTVEEKLRLRLPVGEKEVFKIRVQTEFVGKFESKRDILIYVTTDASHVPVKIEAEFAIGTLVAELTGYQPGRQPALKLAGSGGR